MKTYHVHNPGELVNAKDEKEGAYCVECGEVIAALPKRRKHVFKNSEIEHVWAQPN